LGRRAERTRAGGITSHPLACVWPRSAFAQRGCRARCRIPPARVFGMTGSRPGYGPAEDPDEVRGGQSRAAAASADTGDGAVLDRVLTGPQMRALVAPERIGTGEPADLSARVFRRCDL